MVIAAAAVIAFGALGMLAITDRAPNLTLPPKLMSGAASPHHVVVTSSEAKSGAMSERKDPLGNQPSSR